MPFAGYESSGSEALVRPPVTKKTLFTTRVSLLLFVTVKWREAWMFTSAAALEVTTFPVVGSAALATDESPVSPNRQAAARTVPVRVVTMRMGFAPCRRTLAGGPALVEFSWPKPVGTRLGATSADPAAQQGAAVVRRSGDRQSPHGRAD